MTELDWSTTPLGTPSGWSPALQAVVSLVLHSKTPKFLAWGPELTLLYNDEYLSILGDKHPASLGRPLPEVWSEIWTAIEPYFKEVFAGESVYFEDSPFIIHRNGRDEETWFSFAYTPVYETDGKVAGLYCSLHETTDKVLTNRRRQEYEREIQASARRAEEEHQRLIALLQAAPVGISFVDTSGKMILSNEANRCLWGEHPLSQNVDEYAQWKGWWADGSERHGRPIRAHEWGLTRALRGEEVASDLVEIEPFGATGMRKTILLRATPIRNTNGEIINAVVTQIDISDRVKATAALRQSEAKFRTITEVMPQMAWSTDANGYCDYCNQRWYDFTGATYGSANGEAWENWIHSDDRERTWEYWRHSLETGEAYETEYRLCHHTGQYRWVLVRALPIKDESEQIVRWMGTCTDIHEQKLTQEALQQADRNKDEFLAMLAHELRNPLAPISSAAELLSVGRSDQTQVKQISNVISRQAAHLTSLIDDLLDVSRVTRGLITLDRQPVEISNLVAETVEQIRPLMKANGHVLELHLSSENAWVTGDRKRLVQVLANLLGNAAKYTPPKGHVVLQTSVTEFTVMLSVCDNGIGMSEELLVRAFDLFAQGERTVDRSQGGLGIGLALVKRLVELHGGNVEAKSEGLGKGSQFTVRLPRLHAEQSHQKNEFSSFPVHINQLQVMIVDDNTDAAQILGMYVETLGHQALIENLPSKALDRAAEKLPQICLLDIGLPEFSGYELAQRLRRIPGMEKAIMIAITGYGQPTDKDRAMSAGFNYHFVKPIDMRAFLELLSQIASASESSR